jgi:glyoxylase-like metal-dependent hydrolase (beta-lactamase superfamily II)
MALSYDVFVTPMIPVVNPDTPPGQTESMWSPISATLITGDEDAVLIDPLLTLDQAGALADWVDATGKNLTTIYATHAHGDHWYGASVIANRFPYARFVATDSVVQLMRQQTPEFVNSFWAGQFPGQIPERAQAEPVGNEAIDLEGEDLIIVELGHTDTDSTTCVHVPSLGLVVAGDSVYNDVHLYLAESSPQGRLDWVDALDTIAALSPTAVVAGHKRAERANDPATIEETRRYIADLDSLLETMTTVREIYDEMVGLHPTRLNPGVLWTSLKALRPAR